MGRSHILSARGQRLSLLLAVGWAGSLCKESRRAVGPSRSVANSSKASPAALRPPGRQTARPVQRVVQRAELQADNVLLRGVSCYLKTFLLWEHHFFREEMGLNLYIAVEAGLSVIRRRLSTAAGRQVAYGEVFDIVGKIFGEGLAEYWQDCHDDRTILVHPDNRFGARVMHPGSADDIYELLDPMISLYRYILIDESPPRPSAR